MKTLEHQLAEYCEYQSELHGPISTNEIHGSITSATETHDAAVATGSSWKQATRPVRIAVGAAVAIFILIGSVAWLNWSSGRESGPVITQVPIPTSTPSTVVNQVVPEEAADVLPEAAEPTPPITGMAWQKVIPDGIDPTSDTPEGESAFGGGLVSGGDRFLYVDGNDGTTVAESFDGISWTSRSIPGSVDGLGSGNLVGWRDTLVANGCGETFYGLHPEPGAPNQEESVINWVGAGRITSYPACVSVIRPDGTVATRLFDANIQVVGIGPAGMVAIGADQYDENDLLYVVQPDVVTILTGRDWEDFDDSVIEVTDGVLHIEFRDGQVSDYVLPDHGYTLAGLPAASGWFSQDGEEWIPISDFPVEPNPDGTGWDLIGTEAGFFGISDDFDGHVVAWHSSNGLDWRELGLLPDDGATLSRWSDGAIVIGTDRVWHLSALGIEETPLATPGLGEPGIVTSTSGEVGVAMVIFRAEGEAMELKQVLYSSDGQAWTNTDVSPEIREIPPNLGEWPWFHHVDLAATDTGVLLYLRSGGPDVVDPASAWFLGVPITD